MKTKLQIILFELMILSLGANAKAQCGVYMNQSDFKNNKLAYETACNNGKHNRSIRLHNFFGNMPDFTVYADGKKNTLKKSDVYGFRDCNNQVYRFYRNTEYNIAEAGNIYIYTQTRNVAQSKGFKVVNTYYFSATPQGEIMPLTLINLKYAYHGNEKFLDLLDMFFDSEDPGTYDNLHRTFKVNYLYSKAMNE